MKFIAYLENVIFKYWLSFLVFILILFKRRVPKTLQDKFKEVIDEIKYSPSIKKEDRY